MKRFPKIMLEDIKKDKYRNNISIIFINLIFITFTSQYVFSILNHTPNLIFKFLLIMSIIFYSLSVGTFVKYNNYVWDKLKATGVIIVIISMLYLIMMINNFPLAPFLLPFLSWAPLVVGIIGFCKTHDKLYVSFALWTIFYLIWQTNMYVWD